MHFFNSRCSRHDNIGMQMQTEATAHLTSKQLQLFAFVEQNNNS